MGVFYTDYVKSGRFGGSKLLKSVRTVRYRAGFSVKCPMAREARMQAVKR